MTDPVVNDPTALNALADAKGWYFRCDPKLGFARPELAALTALWREKAGAASPPPREAFDMRSLKPFVRNVALMERHGGETAPRFRFRLFGSSLSMMFGEHTGQFLDEMVPPVLLANWTAIYNMIVRYGAPVRVFNRKLEPLLNGEIFGAPLAPDAEGRAMVMASAFVALKEAMPSSP
ncbi:MAG TPA: PAS domain-containing protein [Rhizomicrobium sp.]|nr:PAS domain-containing protein [Rhizomicrobium sp.]